MSDPFAIDYTEDHFALLLQYYDEIRNSDSDKKNKFVTIKKFFTWLERYDANAVRDASYRMVERFADYLDDEENYTNGTIQNHLVNLNKFYEWLIMNQVVEQNPLDRYKISDEHPTDNILKSRTDRRWISDEEHQQMLEHARYRRDEILLHILNSTGVRAIEASRIRDEDVDLDDGSIRIRSAKKGREDRHPVYLDSTARRELQKWIGKGERDSWLGTDISNAVLPSKRTKSNIHQNTVGNIIRQTSERAGINEVVWVDAAGNKKRKLNTHSYRYAFGRRAVQNGMDLIFLNELLNHSSIDQTREYLQFKEESKKEAFRKSMY